jgi:hypothetical protein
MDLDYVVTGTGRCGTLFLANFLTSAGIPCTHEAIFTLRGLDFAFSVLRGEDKAISSNISKGDNLSEYEMEIRAESSYMSAPFLAGLNTKVIHIVRNPIKVIASFLGPEFAYFSNAFPSSQNEDHIRYENFIYDNLPELREEMPQLDRACLYWTGWNEMIEASGTVSYRHRLEDPISGLEKFIWSRGTYSKVSNASRERGPKWSPAQIQRPDIKKRFKDLARKYGYLSILQ